MKKLNKWFENIISNKYLKIEMIFFIGILIIIFTNFLINLHFGLYSLGFLLIAYSIFLFKFEVRE
ncbi:hypothetical protein FDC27_00370 [Clostridium botulinum]|uniref:Uncharacterized protein n=1 Tax=Clostridium botulinum TaxID=1491 RepID=A0A6B4JKT0_CLOBO|nr:hypothetical protein [Clostridium botulinum]NFL51606.1 hypothetical protein [Clostridium botulinum]NFO65441.1 hypothetical protein [Clostridium botulinum]NFS14953.1 hypothetical protein [Clostridium botulinum]NFV25211.1 hypothetical protein [Clostridium botulinum]